MYKTLRLLGGRQPLCGIGVTSAMLVIFSPQLFRARAADSRPGPGPPTRTSAFFAPCSCAAVPAFSAADCAAQVALDGELCYQRADGIHFRLGEIFHLGSRIDARSLTSSARPGDAHTINKGESDPDVLVHRYVDAGYTCHILLPLPLFVPRI